MALRRAQVLAHREDIDSRGPSGVHRCGDLFITLTEAEHQRGLRVANLPTFLRVAEDRKRLLEARALVANRRLETRHGLEVMREHLGLRVEEDIERREIAGEVH